MKNKILFILICSLFASCSKKETKTTLTADPSDSSDVVSTDIRVEKIPENCYLQVVGNDSTFLHLVDNLGTFTGKMMVKNSEKDSSKGDISGFKNGDTLKLNYTFESEGKTSERPVYFLVKEDGLTEGFGDFDNIKTLKFDDKNQYVNTDCTDFDKNFK